MIAKQLHVRLVAVVVVALAALALPTSAQAQLGATCPLRSVAQVFLPWGDLGWYASVPDGGLEAGGGSWDLRGGAHVVEENEPFHVRRATDRWSLALVPGASAASASMCIGPGHPTVRFFVRNSGSDQAVLTVTVEFTDPSGAQQSVPIGVIGAGAEWQPSPPLPVAINLLSLLAIQHASFRFTASGGGGHWGIDDVYVDPYGKG
ncbi:MAG TPA: hypothetical protein VFG79_25115 [Solirubrobacter sp.]|nr:hypothetical protein [Solirubrobacter sp.]